MRKIGEAKRIKNTETRKHRAINNWRLIIKTPCFRVSVFNFIPLVELKAQHFIPTRLSKVV